MANIAIRPLPAPLPAPDASSRLTRVVIADEPHSYPCRRCLRDADPGERMLLLSYDPFTGDSPYRQPGPIYLHADDCEPDPGDEVPEQLTRRLLSVRAFDSDHLMLEAVVIPGVELAATAETLLGDPAADYLHVHNAAAGCFAARIDSRLTGASSR
jgi:hypothetical protein